METAALKLFDQLTTDLHLIENSTSIALIRFKESAQLTQNVIHQLLDLSGAYTFTDLTEEVKYYKEIKPKFCKLLFYYSRLYQLELERSGSKELFKDVLRKELGTNQEYIRQNQALYCYYRSGDTYLDEQLFVRGNTQIFPSNADDAVLLTDSRRTAACSLILAKLQAGEMVQEHIESELELLTNPTLSTLVRTNIQEGIEWQATKSAIVELGYALYASGAVSKKVDVGKIVERLAFAFNIKVDNMYKIYEQIRLRKKNPTQFITSIQQGLMLKINHDNETLL